MLTGLACGIRHIRHAEDIPTHPLSPRMMTLSRVRLREAMAPKPLDLVDEPCNLGQLGQCRRRLCAMQLDASINVWFLCCKCGRATTCEHLA